MRTVFVFPPDTLAVTTALLDATMPGADGFWTDEKLQVELDSEDRRLGLFSDWEPGDVHRVEEALGYHPTWALQVNVSGRIDGTDEIRTFAAQFLKTGGVAVDDYSNHCWTLQEIESDLKIDGLGFFDFRGHYYKHYQT